MVHKTVYIMEGKEWFWVWKKWVIEMAYYTKISTTMVLKFHCTLNLLVGTGGDRSFRALTPTPPHPPTKYQEIFLKIIHKM